MIKGETGGPAKGGENVGGGFEAPGSPALPREIALPEVLGANLGPLALWQLAARDVPTMGALDSADLAAGHPTAASRERSSREKARRHIAQVAAFQFTVVSEPTRKSHPQNATRSGSSRGTMRRR